MIRIFFALWLASMLVVGMARAALAAAPTGAPPAEKASPDPLTAHDDTRLVMHTNAGDMVVALYPRAAPRHVEQILKLARGGVFDGAPIFRIERDFVAQIESHANRALAPGPLELIQKIPDEFTTIHHRRGILSMAKFDEPNSADSSFSFVLGEAGHLDGKYTVFGEVVEGFDVLTAIENAAVDGNASPLEEVVLQKVDVTTIQQLAREKLAPATAPHAADAAYQAAFKALAAVAFLVTILIPIIQGVWQPLRFSNKQA